MRMKPYSLRDLTYSKQFATRWDVFILNCVYITTRQIHLGQCEKYLQAIFLTHNHFAMKSLLLVLFAFSAFPLGQLDTITQAMSNGDVATLSTFMDESVELAFPGDENSYNKAKAAELLKVFFGKNTPKAFNLAHQGSSKGSDSLYCIGNLATSTGVFRVYIYLHADDGKYLIQELRFDKE